MRKGRRGTSCAAYASAVDGRLDALAVGDDLPGLTQHAAYPLRAFDGRPPRGDRLALELRPPISEDEITIGRATALLHDIGH